MDIDRQLLIRIKSARDQDEEASMAALADYGAGVFNEIIEACLKREVHLLSPKDQDFVSSFALYWMTHLLDKYEEKHRGQDQEEKDS